ncbi:hypothetical protein [Paraburkholderia tropica]|uniref:hypothetical protein n=1 Tax=Paraburkholderia tropica TaxID=92647 RepID=UPI002AB0919C|nr:hypothetical protein [Paraburkholderia tropica]
MVGFFYSADECGRARVNGDKESIAKAYFLFAHPRARTGMQAVMNILNRAIHG